MSANLDNQNQYIGFQKKEEEKRNKKIRKEEVLRGNSKTIEFKTRDELRGISLKKEVFGELGAETIDVKVSVKSELDKKLDSQLPSDNIIEEHRKNLLALGMNKDLLDEFLDRVYNIKAQVSSTLGEDFVMGVISENTNNLAEKFETYNTSRVSRAIFQPLLEKVA